MARIPLVDPADPGLDPQTAQMLTAMEEGNPAGLFNMQRVIADR